MIRYYAHKGYKDEKYVCFSFMHVTYKCVFCMEAKTHSHLTIRKEEKNQTRQLCSYDCINNIIGASFLHDQQTFCLQTNIRFSSRYLFIYYEEGSLTKSKDTIYQYFTIL